MIYGGVTGGERQAEYGAEDMCRGNEGRGTSSEVCELELQGKGFKFSRVAPLQLTVKVHAFFSLLDHWVFVSGLCVLGSSGFFHGLVSSRLVWLWYTPG